jgi:hypothetical protein
MIEQCALSIRQPWAFLILHSGKDIENRTWATRMRGPFYIHAAGALSDTVAERERIRAWVRDRFGVIVPADADLPRGGIVGEAIITDCVSTSSSPWFVGPYGFVIAAAKAVPFRRCAERLGFFSVDD